LNLTHISNKQTILELTNMDAAPALLNVDILLF